MLHVFAISNSSTSHFLIPLDNKKFLALENICNKPSHRVSHPYAHQMPFVCVSRQQPASYTSQRKTDNV